MPKATKIVKDYGKPGKFLRTMRAKEAKRGGKPRS